MPRVAWQQRSEGGPYCDNVEALGMLACLILVARHGGGTVRMYIDQRRCSRTPKD
jgi:hypothetical protein